MSARPTLLTVAFLIGLVTLPAHAQQGPTQAELNAAASNAVDWLLTNHDYGGQRFVDATEITRDNAASLRAACVYQAADLRPFHTNPLVYRGVMYLTTSQATIALDAATCRVQWRHVWRPKAKENWPQSRGVALKEGIIIRGTADGYLLALDALTGRLLWERAAADAEKGETFTMPPVVFEDLVIIGPAGNEVPVRGWVGAFRVATGEPVWRFNTRPAAGELGAETWGMTEALTGGGAVWTPFSLDPAQGLVFVPVGNPAPDFYSDVRQGANLYTNSLVVLDARTGKLVWHYQAVPHDLHDWDLTQVSPLFTAQVNGTERRLVSVVGKDGLLHVLDREPRASLRGGRHPSRERRASAHAGGSSRLPRPVGRGSVERAGLQPADQYAVRRFGGLVRHLQEGPPARARSGTELHGRKLYPRSRRAGPGLADRHRCLDRRDSLALPIAPPDAGRGHRNVQRPAVHGRA